MPEDVSRSDSQRSDASTSRPRVSFNRDVHVKRIGKGGAPRVVGALAGDSASRLHPLAVRRERPSRLSRRDLALEAQRVLKQADSVTCTGTALGLPPPLDAAAAAAAADDAKRFNSLPSRRKKSRLVKQNSSFRESNPRVKEGTSSSSPERIPKRPRVVARSASDAAAAAATLKRDVARPVDEQTRFWSLDRLRSKKNKKAPVTLDARHQQRRVHSDTESRTSPIASILSKRASHSDTEKRIGKNSDSEASAAKKKQLSPIIEASPREDYFLHAGAGEDDTSLATQNKIEENQENTNNRLAQSQLPKAPSRLRKTKLWNNEINKPPSVRHISVEPVKMETLLHSSQTISKPPLTRGLTVDSLVRKLSQDRAGRGPPRVVSPLGMFSPGDERKHNNNLPFSYTEPPYEERYTSLLPDKDTPPRGGGGGVSERDDLPTRTGQPTGTALQGDGQVIYAEVVCNGGGGGGGKAGGGAGLLTKQTVHSSVAQCKRNDEAKAAEMGHHRVSPDYKTEFKTILGDYSGAEGRGRADGMDARRSMTEDDHRSARRNLMDAFISTESRHGQLDSRNGYLEDFIEPVLKPRSDLSLRRDRLESRIESQRKDRLMSSRLIDKSYRSHQNVNEAIIDNARKYPSNPRLDSDLNRREFLASQINHDSGLQGRDDALCAADPFGRSVDNIDKFLGKSDAAAKFTDSGIDIDYRGDNNGGPLLVNNYQTNEVVNETRRTYHNKYEKKKKPEKVRNNSYPTLTNITKVDVNGHIKPGASDDEDQVDEAPTQYYYNSQQNVDQIKAKQAALSASKSSSKETKRDTLPQSSVLIRHVAPQDVTTGEGYRQESSRRRRDLDERRDMEEDYKKPMSGGLGSVEETRRFLLEERRRMVEERKGDDCWRPEKVLQKWNKMELKPPGKKRVGAMEKVKALFSTKKKAVKKVEATPPVADPLTSRYTEYKGEEAAPRAPSRSRNVTSQSQMENRGRRERLATPSPSPSRPPTALNNNNINSNSNNNTGSWFKSLDRLTSRKKPKAKPEVSGNVSEDSKAYTNTTNTTNATTTTKNNNNNVDRGNKNLRFFGDTDAESVRSGGRHSRQPLKAVSSLSTLQETGGSGGQAATRYVPLREAAGHRRYKSANKLQVPRRRHHRSAGELATSSAESTTEGDSSQQSQRSVVYLHAATVGDIPGRAPSRTQRRARSREELSSTTGSNLAPQTRTVSRSISVLAPWKPRHYREPLEVHYENDSNRAAAAKPPKVPSSSYKTSTSTLNRAGGGGGHAKDTTTGYNSLGRVARGGGERDKENVLRKSLNSLHRKGDNSHKSTDSLRDNGGNGKGSDRSYLPAKGRRIGNGVDGSAADYRNGSTTLKKVKTDGGQKRAELARSASMPKDSKVKSGWFRLRKK